MQYKVFGTKAYGEKFEEIACFDDMFGYEKSIAEYFDFKENEEKRALTNADVMFKRVFLLGEVVDVKFFKKLKQTLRHYDEIGLSNEIYELVDTLMDEGTLQALCFSQTALGVEAVGDNVENFSDLII